VKSNGAFELTKKIPLHSKRILAKKFKGYISTGISKSIAFHSYLSPHHLIFPSCL
jgi:hypothetical protein